MELYVNNIPVINMHDLNFAMLFKNQKGEYASVHYILNDNEWELFKDKDYKGFYYFIYDENGKFIKSECVGYQYTFHNWYKDNKECTIKSDTEANVRYFNEELSIKYNKKNLIKLLKNDGITIKD